MSRNIVVGLGGPTSESPEKLDLISPLLPKLWPSSVYLMTWCDLQKKVRKYIIGYIFKKEPIFCKDLKAEGNAVVAALLKEAIKPNLVQTIEGNPAIIHGGPFANIAQGTNSVIATRMGMTFSEYTVTEAGFG